MAINNLSIGRRIGKIRKRRGLSQATLSELVNCSPTYISYIENGTRGMSLETLICIANALNASADELLFDCLQNTNVGFARAFSELVSDCTEYEKRILLDVVSATKGALREHAFLQIRRYTR